MNGFFVLNKAGQGLLRAKAQFRLPVTGYGLPVNL